MQLIKKLSIFLLYFSFLSQGIAQSKAAETTDYHHELGLNVTNLLTDLLGNNNRTEAGMYLLSYKYVSGNRATRIGLTTIISSLAETDFSRSGRTVQLNNVNLQLRFGREKRQNLSPKFQYYIGFDGIAGYKLEESVATTTFASFVQSDRTVTVGLGPVVGFQLAIYGRLLIGTEGSLYAAYNTGTVGFSNQQISAGSVGLPPRKEKTVYSLQTNLPKFLFIILKF
jgi:hypothetical protein